jgi:outer membrane protein assembly factor BamA
VNQIQIEGNKRTKTHIIFRELDIHAGDTLLPKTLDSLLLLNRNRIFNTQLFNAVELKIRPADSLRSDLIIKVSERWYFFPVLIFELADRNFNEWWYDRNRDLNRINYGLGMTHKNFRGRAEQLKTVVQFGFTKRFELGYDIPYIDKSLKNGLGFNAVYSENNEIFYRSGIVRYQDEARRIPRDTVFNKLDFFKSTTVMRTRFEFSAGYVRRSNFYNFHSLNLGYRYHTISDSIALRNPDYFGNGSTFQHYAMLQYTFTHDRRDIQAYPLRGNYLNVSLTRFGLLPSDNLNRFALAIQYAAYREWGKKWFVSAGWEGRLSVPGKQPYFNLRALGFNQTLVRGYDRYVVDGTHLALAKLTFKRELLRSERSFPKLIRIPQFQTIPVAVFLKTFFDTGYVWDPTYNIFNRRLANRMLYGYGIGLDIVTFYNVVIGLDYSRNREQENNFFFRFSRDI